LYVLDVAEKDIMQMHVMLQNTLEDIIYRLFVLNKVSNILMHSYIMPTSFPFDHNNLQWVWDT
jgi:hypothetical protein